MAPKEDPDGGSGSGSLGLLIAILGLISAIATLLSTLLH